MFQEIFCWNIVIWGGQITSQPRKNCKKPVWVSCKHTICENICCWLGRTLLLHLFFILDVDCKQEGPSVHSAPFLHPGQFLSACDKSLALVSEMISLGKYTFLLCPLFATSKWSFPLSNFCLKMIMHGLPKQMDPCTLLTVFPYFSNYSFSS